MNIKFTDEKKNWITFTMDDGGRGSSCYPPELGSTIEMVKDFLAAGGVIEDAYIKEELYARRYQEVTDKTSRIIDGSGFVYGGVAFHTDMVAQMNFSGLFAVRAGLLYTYTVWDGEGSVGITGPEEMERFCMGFMAYIEAVRKEGKTIRDSLKNLDLQQLIDFVDTRVEP